MAEMTQKITVALDAAMATADSGAVPAAAGQDRPELRKAIEEIVDSGFTGIALRVHDERGEWAGSAGVAELGETARPPINGYVRIGSNTKTFTATMVLQLVAEGTIGLDTPVAGCLPEFGLDERITVRMLLQHTSGVFNFTGEVHDDGTVVLVPEGFDDYITDVEHALQDPRYVALIKRGAEAAAWAPDDPRIDELATAMADHFLANPAQLKIVTGLRARTDVATRYTLIAHHGEERGSAAARALALVETKLRAAGIPIPRPDSH